MPRAAIMETTAEAYAGGMATYLARNPKSDIQHQVIILHKAAD